MVAFVTKIWQASQLEGIGATDTHVESTVKLFVHSFLHFKCNVMASLHS